MYTDKIFESTQSQKIFKKITGWVAKPLKPTQFVFYIWNNIGLMMNKVLKTVCFLKIHMTMF